MHAKKRESESLTRLRRVHTCECYVDGRGIVYISSQFHSVLMIFSGKEPLWESVGGQDAKLPNRFQQSRCHSDESIPPTFSISS